MVSDRNEPFTHQHQGSWYRSFGIADL